MKNHLHQQYQDYADEKLIHILSEEEGAYTVEAKAVAEEVLRERGYDVEHQEAFDQDPAAQFDEMERPDGLIHQDILVRESEHGVTGRINTLIDNIEQQEEKLQGQLSTELKAISDEELLSQYTTILAPFTEKTSSKIKALGPIAEMELRTMITEVNTRPLSLPPEVNKVHKRIKFTLNEMTLKEGRRKQNFNGILGAFLAIFPLLFFALGASHRLSIISVIIGIERIYAGFRAMSSAREKLL